MVMMALIVVAFVSLLNVLQGGSYVSDFCGSAIKKLHRRLITSCH